MLEEIEDAKKFKFYDGFVIVIYEDYCIQHVIVDVDEPLSLWDIEQEVIKLKKEKGIKPYNLQHDIIHVIHDDYLTGEVYVYGNYADKKWWIYGETMGFA